MVVKTQEKRAGCRGAMGLHVGSDNVRQYFPRHIETIELELDHLRISCSLDPSFWQDRPEIHDVRLSSWLESKRNSGKLSAQGTPVALIPNGHFSFRLQMVTDALPRDPADYALTGPPATAYFSPPVSPVALHDRRVHNVGNEMGRKPDRRRVGKLNGDERTSLAAAN